MNCKSVSNRLKSFWLDWYRKHEPYQRLDYPKKDFFLCENVRIGSCSREPETIKWIEGFKKNDVVYDVGANIGAYSLVMSVYAQSVFAFEPAITNFSLLCKNIILNLKAQTIRGNITPLNLALSDRNELLPLEYANFNLGKSGHQILESTDSSTNSAKVSMPTLTIKLDDLVEKLSLPRPNHLKIDVDGIESKILMGASGMLSSNSIRSVLCEMKADSEEEALIKKLMDAKGFVQIGRFDPSENVYNYLFKKNG